jgi:superfamily I DNA and/or RNA helicase
VEEYASPAKTSHKKGVLNFSLSRARASAILVQGQARWMVSPTLHPLCSLDKERHTSDDPDRLPPFRPSAEDQYDLFSTWP